MKYTRGNTVLVILLIISVVLIASAFILKREAAQDVQTATTTTTTTVVQEREEAQERATITTTSTKKASTSDPIKIGTKVKRPRTTTLPPNGETTTVTTNPDKCNGRCAPNEECRKELGCPPCAPGASAEYIAKYCACETVYNCALK